MAEETILGALVEYAKDTAGAAILEEGKDMVDEGLNYLKRKADQVKEFVVDEIHEVGSLMNGGSDSLQLVKNDYYQTTLDKHVTRTKHRTKRVKRGDLPSNIIPASRTLIVPIREAHVHNAVQKGIYPLSYTSMPYTYWKRRRAWRRRGRRFRKRRKTITKRGAKNIAARVMGMSPYQKFTNISKSYFGDTSGSAPAPAYGRIVRSELIHFYENQITNTTDGTQKLDSLISSKPGLNTVATNNYKYSFRKIVYNMELHSCVNEMFEATFWWLMATDESDTVNDSPLNLWKAEYVDKNQDLINASTDFDADWTTYPTMYKAFNDQWKIVKKYKTVFNPGQTKKLRLKGMPFIYKNADNPSGSPYIRKGKTMVLLYQLKGVPTHQNASGTQTTDVNLTPAALDVIIVKRFEIARSVYTDGVYAMSNNLPTVTAGVSLMPEASATITTV